MDRRNGPEGAPPTVATPYVSTRRMRKSESPAVEAPPIVVGTRISADARTSVSPSATSPTRYGRSVAAAAPGGLTGVTCQSFHARCTGRAVRSTASARRSSAAPMPGATPMACAVWNESP